MLSGAQQNPLWLVLPYQLAGTKPPFMSELQTNNTPFSLAMELDGSAILPSKLEMPYLGKQMNDIVSRDPGPSVGAMLPTRPPPPPKHFSPFGHHGMKSTLWKLFFYYYSLWCC